MCVLTHLNYEVIGFCITVYFYSNPCCSHQGNIYSILLEESRDTVIYNNAAFTTSQLCTWELNQIHYSIQKYYFNFYCFN